jgi:hypothetical protein
MVDLPQPESPTKAVLRISNFIEILSRMITDLLLGRKNSHFLVKNGPKIVCVFIHFLDF